MSPARIEHGDVDCLAVQTALASNARPKDLHSGDTEREREERLPHGGIDRLPERAPLLCNRIARKQMGEIGKQVERDALARTGQRHGPDAEQEHDDEQRRHHDLRYTLDALLKANRTGNKADSDGNEHPDDHLGGVLHHGREHLCSRVNRSICELTRREFWNVGNHPAGDGRVEHHEDHAADIPPPAKPVEAALWLEDVKGECRALLARTADGKLHDHDGQAENHEENQVQQHEGCSSVLTRDVWKAPDVANADGAACRDENKSDT